MAVWGFGALKACYAQGRGGLKWLSDVVDLFNTMGIHWTLWGLYGENLGLSENEAAKAILRKALTEYGILPVEGRQGAGANSEHGSTAGQIDKGR